MNKHPASRHMPNSLPASSGRSKGATIAGEAPGILKGEGTSKCDFENDTGLGGSGDSDQRRRNKSRRIPPCWI